MKQRDNHIDKTKTIGTLKFQWFDDGADDENRTRNASLGSWSFTTKLHPHCYIIMHQILEKVNPISSTEFLLFPWPATGGQ